jgi:hypothetical protein
VTRQKVRLRRAAVCALLEEAVRLAGQPARQLVAPCAADLDGRHIRRPLEIVEKAKRGSVSGEGRKRDGEG